MPVQSISIELIVKVSRVGVPGDEIGADGATLDVKVVDAGFLPVPQ